MRPGEPPKAMPNNEMPKPGILTPPNFSGQPNMGNLNQDMNKPKISNQPPPQSHVQPPKNFPQPPGEGGQPIAPTRIDPN